MFGLLLLVFIIVPLVEIFIIVQVTGGLGLLPTIGLLILMSVIGAWLVKREGLSVVQRVQDALNGGRMPRDELLDGAMILGGGALMLTPGFLTDLVGMSLLLPPVRAVLRPFLAKAVKSKITVATGIDPDMFSSGPTKRSGFGFGRRRGPVYDAESTEKSSRRGRADPNELPPS